MSDNELVAWVGEHLVEPSGIGGLYRPSPRHAWHTGDGDEWRPLDDWNHAMQVVAAMHQKLFSVRRQFMIELQRIVSDKVLPTRDRKNSNLVAWPDVFWHMGHRAVLLAAKQALESTKEGASK